MENRITGEKKALNFCISVCLCWSAYRSDYCLSDSLFLTDSYVYYSTLSKACFQEISYHTNATKVARNIDRQK